MRVKALHRVFLKEPREKPESRCSSAHKRECWPGGGGGGWWGVFFGAFSRFGSSWETGMRLLPLPERVLKKKKKNPSNAA